MTYTATEIPNPVRVSSMRFSVRRIEDTSQTVAEHFRMAIRREKSACIWWTDGIQPVSFATLWFARCLAAMHRGRINTYVTYAFLALLIVFAVLPAY